MIIIFIHTCLRCLLAISWLRRWFVTASAFIVLSRLRVACPRESSSVRKDSKRRSTCANSFCRDVRLSCSVVVRDDLALFSCSSTSRFSVRILSCAMTRSSWARKRLIDRISDYIWICNRMIGHHWLSSSFLTVIWSWVTRVEISFSVGTLSINIARSASISLHFYYLFSTVTHLFPTSFVKSEVFSYSHSYIKCS